MTLRRKSRIFALQMLFEWDMTRQDPARVEKLFWRSAPATASTRDFANQLFEGAVKQVDTLDELAAKFAENWRLERIAAIDRNILRLAIYEMRAATAPSKVVINEALELAKKFSSARAPSFLNGVLDAVRRSLAT
jgi:N utilization substance protein B